MQIAKHQWFHMKFNNEGKIMYMLVWVLPERRLLNIYLTLVKIN